DAGAQAGELLENGLDDLLGRPGIGRAFEDHQLPGPHVGPDRARGVLDVRHVRLAVRVERRRDAENERVGLRGLAEVESGAEGRGPGDALRGNVLDVRLALAERVDLALVDVEADDGKALLAE